MPHETGHVSIGGAGEETFGTGGTAGVPTREQDPTTQGGAKGTQEQEEEEFQNRFQDLYQPGDELVPAEAEDPVSDPNTWTESTTFGIPEVISYFEQKLEDGLWAPVFIPMRIPMGAVMNAYTGTHETIYNDADEYQEIVEARSDGGLDSEKNLGPIFARSLMGTDLGAETFDDDYSDLGSSGYVYGLMHFDENNNLVEMEDIFYTSTTDSNQSAWLLAHHFAGRAGISSFASWTWDNTHINYSTKESEFLGSRFGYTAAVDWGLQQAAGGNEVDFYTNIINDAIEAITEQIQVSDIGNQIVNKIVDYGNIQRDEITSIVEKEGEQGVSTFVAAAPSEVTSGGSTSGY